MSRTDVDAGATTSGTGTTTDAGSRAADGEAPTVLIAEDQRSLAELYVAGLPDGCVSRVAGDGEEALSLVDDEVDIALLDRQMPKLTGDEVLERIREAGYGCRVAMLTGIDPDFDVIEMGFDEYLVKPISIDELREVVERLLTLSTYDAEIREYYALLSKRSALESQKNAAELERDERFAALEADIDALAGRLDARRDELDDADPAALFDDLDGNAL